MKSSFHSEALATAEQAVRAAGAHLLASRSRLAAAMLMQQGPLEVADAIEREAVGLVRQVMQRRFPAFEVLDSRQAPPADGRPAWIVDGLDGQASYLRGSPQYAVALALVGDGQPHIGVVFDPCRDELFQALRGRGARLNGQRIRCAQRGEPGQALAATVFPKPASPRMVPYMGELGRVQRALGGLRRSESSALELAHLAAGRIDAFWAHDAHARDTEAGALLAREAGAEVDAWGDDERTPDRCSLTASTPAVRATFHALLARA